MNETRPGPGLSQPSSQGNHPTIAAPPTLRPPPLAPHAEERLALSGEDRGPEAKSRIHVTSEQHLAAINYKRTLNNNKTGAMRMRIFHCRLSENGVEYMEHAINEWLENHPEIEIKTSNTVVGMWDGKIKENNLICTIWY